MKFGIVQEIKFKTSEGAYSRVTETELKDHQITLDVHEADLVIKYFGVDNIHKGNVKSNEGLAGKSFCLYPTKEEIKLNLVFPKPDKKELRLYIKKDIFYPKSGDIWFIFKKGNKLLIGSMDEAKWRNETSIIKEDNFDEAYQNSVYEIDKIRISKLKSYDKFLRDRKIALKRMEMAKFKCEFNPSHDLFISRSSSKPYLEAHHLIPMGLQKHYSKPLDMISNVFCLCPYCHRAVHHASEQHAREILYILASKRNVLYEFNLQINDLFSFYSVEEITKR